MGAACCSNQQDPQNFSELKSPLSPKGTDIHGPAEEVAKPSDEVPVYSNANTRKYDCLILDGQGNFHWDDGRKYQGEFKEETLYYFFFKKLGTSQSKDKQEFQIFALEKQLGIHKFSISELKWVKNLHFI